MIAAAAGAVLLPQAETQAKKPAPQKQPNILVILADDLGLGDLSCQYAKDIQTPHIDRLFEQGVRLDNFYAGSNVSSPSRAGLLTGRYPILVGVPGVIRESRANNWGWLSPDAVLLPQVLHDNGYNTACIGKWHLGIKSPNLPNDRGFELFKGLLDGMIEDYYTHKRKEFNFMRINDQPVETAGVHATELFTNWAMDYVDGRKREKQPFFLYLAYNAPHVPLQPPTEWEQKVLQRENNISPTRAKLVALIEHLDHNIGRLIARLEQNGQLDNTLIVFLSDNGGDPKAEANNGPFRGNKGDMYEGGIHVPCTFYWRGRLTPARYDSTVMMADLFPTLCDFASAPAGHTVDGISVWPLIQGHSQRTDDRYFLWAKVGAITDKGERRQSAIRYGDYKLVKARAAGNYELFNLATDPHEASPLPCEGEPYESLIETLRKHLAAADRVPYRNPAEPVPARMPRKQK